MPNGIDGNWTFVILVVAVFGTLAFLAIMRRRESEAVLSRFGREDIILSTFGVNYFGRLATHRKPLRSGGVLALVRDGLYYRARFRKREVFIPASSIRALEAGEFFNGRPLYQKAVMIHYVDGEGRADTAVFRIPFPDRWVQAIEKNFMQ